MRTEKGKLSKLAIEHDIRGRVEMKGGVFIKINWKKAMVHFLDNKGNKQVKPIEFRRGRV